jgi:predicted NAD/FAD-binding protein
MTKKRVAVVGGGATGVSLLWCLTSQDVSRDEVELTLFHDEDRVGGHSRTIPVYFDGSGKAHLAPDGTTETVYPVDIGVQFVCPTLYPNLYKQLALGPFDSKVELKAHAELKISGSFRDDINWGNFDPYQHGPKFAACFTPDARADAERFQGDMKLAWLKIFAGKRMWDMNVGQYLEAAGYSFEGNFFRYMLVPYLCIINGYGTSDLLETDIQDLFPIFAKLPVVQEAGPYAAFTDPGKGWDRFLDGAQEWVSAMAAVAEGYGARVQADAYVTEVRKAGAEVEIVWRDKDGVAHEERFDEVVLTTDMTTNRQLLDNPGNPHWDEQKGYIAEQKFELLPGVCYIHQDESVLAPPLRDHLEDGQFNGYYCWDPSAGNILGVPYKLEQSFQTYLMQNILATPYPCYVSMYAKDEGSVVPAPEKTVYKKTWRHGRWVAGFFDQAKRELHRIQGLGGIWFAGNNTTVDSEEGALVSAMVISEKLSGYTYPFPKLSEAHILYQYFKDMMFPRRTLHDMLAEKYRDEL